MSQKKDFFKGFKNIISNLNPDPESEKEGTEVLDRKKAKLRFDRTNPWPAQARGHNSRIKHRYPDIWRASLVTVEELTEWLHSHKDDPCKYCGNPAKEIDHIQPLSKGGEHKFENMQLICERCNRTKHDMTEEEFLPLIAQILSSPDKVGVKEQAKLSLTAYGIPKAALKDKLNRPRTRSLFKETCYNTSGEYPVLFTLKYEEDRDDLISVKRVYMGLEDPTEYLIATQLFCGIQHWRVLCKQEWFSPYVTKWRKELKAKLRAFATTKILEIAQGSSQGAIQALRSIVQEDFLFHSFVEDDLPKKKVGRPEKEKPDLTIPDAILKADLERIGLN